MRAEPFAAADRPREFGFLNFNAFFRVSRLLSIAFGVRDIPIGG
jgi:hypothetical protein